MNIKDAAKTLIDGEIVVDADCTQWRFNGDEFQFYMDGWFSSGLNLFNVGEKLVKLKLVKEPLCVKFESVVTNMGFEHHPTSLIKLHNKKVKITVQEVLK